jgi:hypothetical protein
MYSKILNLIRIFLIFYFCSTVVKAQIPRPDKAYGIISVSVDKIDTLGTSLRYSYFLRNSEQSKQVLDAFTIFISDPAFKKNPNLIKYQGPKKWYLDGIATNGAIFGAAASRIIELPPENGLKPNEEINFKLFSNGLPGLVPYYTEGFTPPITFELLDTLYAQGYTDEEIFLDWKEESYKGITISPKVWPEDFDTSTFIDSLDSYQHRSCEELGWITNQGICNSLRVKLRNVRRHLERDKPKQARNVLRAFINQVEAQRGKHITEEGYALLYFNAEYLMDKLDSGRED